MTNIEKFMQVEDLITDSLWTQARTVNATIIPQGAIEDQARTVNQIWIERLIARATGMYVTGQPFNPDGPAFNPFQYAQISAIAYKCPFTDGPAVYLARAMKNLADKRNNYFIDDCPVYDPGYRLEQPKNAAALAPAFKLYPNPAKASINLEALLPEGTNAKLSVFNPTGQLIDTYRVSDGLQILSTDKWAQGIYLFQIKTDDGKVFSHKIVILN